MQILEPSMALYSNQWFSVLKKSRALQFIQDLQPTNKVTIKNKECRPIIDEIAFIRLKTCILVMINFNSHLKVGI